MNNALNYWNAETLATITSLFLQGRSYGQIAKQVGKTRNSIGGVIFRLREAGMMDRNIPKVLRPRSQPLHKPVKPTPKPQSAPYSRLRDPKAVTAPTPQKTIQHPPMTPATLFERTGCAFPINDGGPFLFCDRKVHERTPYCEFHERLMVQQR